MVNLCYIIAYPKGMILGRQIIFFYDLEKKNGIFLVGSVNLLSSPSRDKLSYIKIDNNVITVLQLMVISKTKM